MSLSPTPTLLIFAGPNGSGKSTISDPARLAALGIDFPDRYINADEIAKQLKRDEPQTDPIERERAAFTLARRLRAEYCLNGISYAFETVLSHPSTLLDMRRARDSEFFVQLVFVTTENPKINVERVARRVLLGGHDVPTDRIIARYERSLSLLPRAVEDADSVFVFDTSAELAPRLVYTKGPFEAFLAPSGFLVRALEIPLRERRAEREKYDGAMERPDEASGAYEGEIVAVTSHFFVQKVSRPPGTILVRHDRLLVSGDAAVVGDSATVVYRDAAGTLTIPPRTGG